MVNVAKFPTKSSQASGGKFQTFKDLKVIHNTGNGYAESNNPIQASNSSPNRPSTLTLTCFNFNLPVGAVVNKVTIELKHAKTGDSNKTSCNIGAPTISLLYNNKVISCKASDGEYVETYKLSKKGQAPKMVADTCKTTFNGKTSVEAITGGVAGGSNTNTGILTNTGITSTNKSSAKTKKLSLKYDFPSRAKVNDSSFGVQVNYPTNTNKYTGKIRVWWVRILIDYTLSSFKLKMSQVKREGTGYNHEKYHVKLTISRTSKTNYVPSVTISVPSGFSYIGTENPNPNVITSDNVGTVTKVDNHTLKYNPALSKSNAASSSAVELIFDVEVYYAKNKTVYSAVFEATESLNDTTASLSVKISDRPKNNVSETSETDEFSNTGNAELGGVNPFENRIYAVAGEEFQINISKTDRISSAGVGLASDGKGIFYANPKLANGSNFESIKKEINSDNVQWNVDYGIISNADFNSKSNDDGVLSVNFKVYIVFYRMFIPKNFITQFSK